MLKVQSPDQSSSSPRVHSRVQCLQHTNKLIQIFLLTAILPKSTNTRHIQENIEVFSFTLTTEDMKTLNNLNKNTHFCWNPEDVAWEDFWIYFKIFELYSKWTLPEGGCSASRVRTVGGESRISRKKGCCEFSSLSYRQTIYVADASHQAGSNLKCCQKWSDDFPIGGTNRFGIYASKSW